MIARDEAATTANYQVRALDRALDILDAFSLDEPALTLTEIAARVNLAKSTATRLIAVLEERGWLERSAETERYRIGVRAFELGQVYIQTTTLDTEARPYLQRLAQSCNQTANLGILDRGEVVHIAVVAPARPIRFNTATGQREEAHSTGLGKMLLAELPDAELGAIVDRLGLTWRTPRTITTLTALREHLATVREQGYALDDEESHLGLRCVALPIRDARGAVVASISVSGLADEFGPEAIERYRVAVGEAAAGISARLGYGVRAGAGA
jgi:DNA-binding IclR family transcriptional regulator